jgi:hypothetical protein
MDSDNSASTLFEKEAIAFVKHQAQDRGRKIPVHRQYAHASFPNYVLRDIRCTDIHILSIEESE